MGLEGKISLGHFASLWDKGTREVCTGFLTDCPSSGLFYPMQRPWPVLLAKRVCLQERGSQRPGALPGWFLQGPYSPPTTGLSKPANDDGDEGCQSRLGPQKWNKGLCPP